MAKYHHLSWNQRLALEALLKQNISVKSIAAQLGCHISTIYREKKRGLYSRLDGDTWIYYDAYSPDIAQEKYNLNLAAKGAPIKLGKDHRLANYIEESILKEKLSPEAALGRIKANNMSFGISICTSTLYSYIRKGVFCDLTMKDCPMSKQHKKAKKQRVAKRASRGTSIEHRPAEIGKRCTFGHWEMDCVCGPTRTSLLVLSERLSRKEIIFHIPDKTTSTIVSCIDSLEHSFGALFPKLFRSITVDNGSEFSDVHGIERSIHGGTRTKVYYCHPFCSSERGTNERLNREIRRLIPKGSNLSKLTVSDIATVEKWVNNYPRRIFNYNTSESVFQHYLAQL